MFWTGVVIGVVIGIVISVAALVYYLKDFSVYR